MTDRFRKAYRLGPVPDQDLLYAERVVSEVNPKVDRCIVRRAAIETIRVREICLALQRFCHAEDCLSPNECPEQHVTKCIQGLDALTSIAWGTALMLNAAYYVQREEWHQGMVRVLRGYVDQISVLRDVAARHNGTLVRRPLLQTLEGAAPVRPEDHPDEAARVRVFYLACLLDLAGEHVDMMTTRVQNGINGRELGHV